MARKEIALDAEAHLHLLTRLWNIKEMIELGEEVVAHKEVKKLIKEVRYSDIVVSYELMKDE
jgi:hypothetical protein